MLAAAADPPVAASPEQLGQRVLLIGTLVRLMRMQHTFLGICPPKTQP